MEEELSKWEEDVKSRRESFYELNYYTTMQLLTLRSELGRLKDSSKKVSISPEVLALLQSISTQVNPTQVMSAVSKVLLEAEMEAEPEPTPVVVAPSEPLTKTEGNKPDIAVEVSAKNDSRDTTKTLVPETESSSKQQQFSEDDLSEELKGYVTTIAFRVDCSRQLVYKAFDVLGKELPRINYERWCVENMDNYTFEDENDSEDEESSESESDNDSTASNEEEEFNYVQGICS